MYRLILEDTYESFIRCLHSLIYNRGVHKTHVVRFKKNDGVNYKRLTEVVTLMSEVSKNDGVNISLYESFYILLDKHLQELSATALVNQQNEIFFSKKLLDVILASRTRSMYLEARPIELATYERFTSSHRLLSETDLLFDANTVIKTSISNPDNLQKCENSIEQYFAVKEGHRNPLGEKFSKLVKQYKEEYLMSRVAFAEIIPTENLDIKNAIIEQNEDFVRAFFDFSNHKNIKYVYRQKFNNDAKEWMLNRLEHLQNT